MGLLDGYLTGGQGQGGLLGSLLKQIMERQQQQQPQMVPTGLQSNMPAPSAWQFANTSALPQGGSPMPMQQQAPPLPPPINVPDATTMQLPPNARPTAQQSPDLGLPPPPATIAPANAASPDFGDRMTAGFQGLTHSPTLISGLGNLIAGMSTGQRSDPQGMQQQQQQATFQALVARGVPPAEAQAATLNPAILAATAKKYFETQPLQHDKIKDALGSESPIVFNPNTGKYTDMGGKPLGGGGDTGPGGNLTAMAPGVKFDANKSGDDYLAQFSPEVRAAVKSYIAGDVLPSGNPRQNGIANFAKTVAQKYGQDMGIPVSDALYSERRRYRTELGSNSASTAGGQSKAFAQGIEHASALADVLQKLDNSNGLGIPIIAKGINTARQAVSTEQSALADKVSTIGQTLAGEVGKLFSGSAGGGVEERRKTSERFNSVHSKPQLAAALEATLETMEGGLKALEMRRDQIMGPNSNVEIVAGETKAKIDKLKESISALKGEAPAKAPAAAGGWSIRPVQ